LTVLFLLLGLFMFFPYERYVNGFISLLDIFFVFDRIELFFYI